MSDAKKWIIVVLIVAGIWLANRYAPGPSPTPTPPPDPVPQPPPIVVTEPAAYVFVVYETLDVPLINLLNDDYWNSLREQGYSVLQYQVTDGAVETYRDMAKAAGLPTLFAVQKDGTVLLKQKLPATIGEVETALRPFLRHVSAGGSSTTKPNRRSAEQQTQLEIYLAA